MNSKVLSDECTILISHQSLFDRRGLLRLLRSLMDLCLPFIICCFLGVFSGCVIIPTPEHTLLDGRGKIEASDVVFLENAKTTREEVLLRFGEPDLILDHDRVLVYHWAVSHGYWFVGAYYTGAGGPIPKDYLFILEFDDQGFLKRFERTGSIWTSAQARLDRWTPQGTEKSPNAGREIFIIDPAPQAHAKADRSNTAVVPVRFRMGEFRHLRTDSPSVDLIGHKVAAFGVIVADVRTCRPFIDMVRSAITAQLETAGHHLVDRDADVIITGDLAEFGVTTSISLSSWDAIGSLDITVKIDSSSTSHDLLIRRYKAKHVSKTFLGPSKENFEQVMRACLEDMQGQIASDAELRRLLGGNLIE
ncbi:MAG: YajG family lipoprotein [Deltaproteobacteria bacterium]